MPRSSGTYTLPAGNPVTTGTTITSNWANTTLSDIATALTGSVATDGTSPMTGILQMGNNKITGVANGTASTDVATVFQISNPTITGGTIDGAPIGAANPKNGAFLALSATSATLTGVCTATTVTPGSDSSTKIATTAFVQSAISAISSGVTSFNTRSGAVTLTSGDVTTALTFTPYNAGGATVITTSNISSYAPTVSGTGAYGTWGISISGNAATASTATSATSATTAGTITGVYSGTLTSGQVTTALTYTPANTVSPTFTGTPIAPTQTVGTAGTTQIATTAYVNPGSSLTGSNGYSKLGSGMIINYGYVSTNSSGLATITFSQAFTSGSSYSMTLTPEYTAGYAASYYSGSASGASVSCFATSTNAGFATTVHFIAIGY
jgi:hypothetical protein